MGVDAVVRFFSSVPLSEADTKRLSGLLNEAMGYGHTDGTRLRIEPVEGQPATYSISNPWRYYGEYYERGPWPELRAVIAWLMHNIEGYVEYGGDCESFPTLVTEERLAAIDRHWAVNGHRPYLGPRGDDPRVVCEDCQILMCVSCYQGKVRYLECGGCGKTREVTL